MLPARARKRLQPPHLQQVFQRHPVDEVGDDGGQTFELLHLLSSGPAAACQAASKRPQTFARSGVNAAVFFPSFALMGVRPLATEDLRL
jgi:hypothetical protein